MATKAKAEKVLSYLDRKQLEVEKSQCELCIANDKKRIAEIDAKLAENDLKQEINWSSNETGIVQSSPKSGKQNKAVAKAKAFLKQMKGGD